MRLANELAASCVWWALANVEYIIQVDGMRDVESNSGPAGWGKHSGIRGAQVLHSNYDDMMQIDRAVP